MAASELQAINKNMSELHATTYKGQPELHAVYNFTYQNLILFLF